jgi:hypothetical protein
MNRYSAVGSRLLAVASLVVLTWFSHSVALGVTYTTTFGVQNDFVEPTHWSVGDDKSTYQEWDYLGNSGDDPSVARGPDATNPRGLSFSGSSYFNPGSPTLAAQGPVFGPATGYSYGMVSSSSHNLYALETGAPGPPPANVYTGITADVFNYGTGDPGEGTHVIVQTGISLNASVGVVPGTLQLVDIGTGMAISGGEASSAKITQTNLYTNLLVEPPGADSQIVDYEEAVYEFFLPNYFGDFQLQFNQEWSTSLDALRIDTLIGPSFAETPGVPEPGTGVALLVALGSFCLVRQRRRAVVGRGHRG